VAADTERTLKGFVVAAPSSGSGKTTLTLALLGALKRKGLKVQAFKCGPDFIDPTLHRVMTGRASRNLDIRMCGDEYVQSCFREFSAEADVSVVEGVMGLFDGGTSSTAAVARTLKLPVLLVVDAGRMAESAAATLKGFETLDPDLKVMGVVLNNVGSARHLSLLTGAIARHCTSPVLGHFPRTPGLLLPERHLGLHMGHEGVLNADLQARLEETALRHLDLEAILSHAVRLSVKPEARHQATCASSRPVRIAVAMDAAFCFYYEDNLDLFRSLGAEVVPFSPLSDASLPEGISALYLGGGYPELHAGPLSKNRDMLDAVRNWVSGGGITYAECGGFMYLTEAILDLDGNRFPMAGCFPVISRIRGGRAALGYRAPALRADTFFGTAGRVLNGHEFHYSDIENMPAAIERVFKCDEGLEGYRIANTIGSYLHAHFGNSGSMIQNLINACRRAADDGTPSEDASSIISSTRGG